MLLTQEIVTTETAEVRQVLHVYLGDDLLREVWNFSPVEGEPTARRKTRKV